MFSIVKVFNIFSHILAKKIYFEFLNINRKYVVLSMNTISVNVIPPNVPSSRKVKSYFGTSDNKTCKVNVQKGDFNAMVSNENSPALKFRGFDN